MKTLTCLLIFTILHILEGCAVPPKVIHKSTDKENDYYLAEQFGPGFGYITITKGKGRKESLYIMMYAFGGATRVSKRVNYGRWIGVTDTINGYCYFGEKIIFPVTHPPTIIHEFLPLSVLDKHMFEIAMEKISNECTENDLRKIIGYVKWPL